MRTQNDNYWSATKHPWACVLFVLPLLAIYEVGLYAVGQTSPDNFRNGADAWLRTALSQVGISPVYGAPALLLFILLLWGLWRRDGRPLDKVGVWVGMTAESAFYALVLVGLSQGVWQLLARADHVFGQGSHRIVALPQWSADPALMAPDPVWGHVISYLGAGIYEETLFRLLLYAGLLRVFCWAEVPTRFNVFLAALASALLFAGAHHLGPQGDPFDVYVFSFRTFAGVYFAWLFQMRGFGIAVGAHAGYDVTVGLILATV